MNSGFKTGIPLKRSFYQRDSFDEPRKVSPYELLKQGKSIVILGEPGMGKTYCLKQIARSSEQYIWVPPASFIRNPNRFKPKSPDQHLIIDGIDELAALQDTDVLHVVLTALAKVDCPKFLMSCRSAEWKHISLSRQIENDYGVTPEVLTLEGITREQAFKFLSDFTKDRRARTILDYLDKVNLNRFYNNPLYLNLILGILGSGENVTMTSKYELYDRVSKVLLSEHNNANIETSRLGKLSIDEALDSAGAICASMLVTGKIYVTSNQQLDKRDNNLCIDISEIESLPNASKAIDVLNSSLFKVADYKPRCRIPYHRSLAEFLAARWIANTLRDKELSRNRFLQSIMVEAQFPASLRGMCAWLALHEEFTDKVIETDPYGLVLYSDIERLPSAKIRMLIDELVVLDQKSPSFRNEDWSEYVPKGLVREDTTKSVEKVILNEEIGSQLKQLMVEAVKDSNQTSVFEKSLMEVLHKLNASYTLRLNVLEILLAISNDVSYWTKIIKSLRRQNFSDSTEFCIFILEEIGATKFPNSLVSECILAETGFLKDRDRSGMLHSCSVSRLTNHFDVNSSVEILDRISSGIADFLNSENNVKSYNPSWECISSFCFPLLETIYKANSLDFGKLLYWTMSIAPYGFSENLWRRGLDSILSDNTEFRRGLQSHHISIPCGRSYLELFRFRFAEISNSLELSFDDCCFHIEQVVNRQGSDKDDHLIWSALVSFRTLSIDELDHIANLSKTYIENNKELQSILTEQRERSLASIDQSIDRSFERKDKSDDKKLNRRSKRRELIQKNIKAFERGCIEEVVNCAKDYLGINRYENYYSNPHERVTKEIGSDLLSSALKGFRAVMHKEDFPSPEEVHDSYSRNRPKLYVYPILAALTEYVSDSVTFQGVSDEMLLIGYLGLEYDWQLDYSIKEKLYVSLKSEVFRRFEESDIYRRWTEPQIKNGSFDYSNFLSSTDHFQNPSVVIPIVVDWLQSYDNISISDTKKLVSDLLYPKKHYSLLNKERLLEIALNRLGNDDNERATFWASVVFYLDIEVFCKKVPSRLKANENLIWNIRDTSTKKVYTDQDEVKKVDLELSGKQLHWIISNFRKKWKLIKYWPGELVGDRNPWDASIYLQSCIERLGTNVDEPSRKLLDSLETKASDSYSKGILVSKSTQKRARIQHNFQPLTLSCVKNLLNDTKPSSPKDLQTLFLASLDKLQSKLVGDQVDTVKRFYTDSGVPRIENDCRDLIIGLLDGRDRFNLIPEYTAPNRTRSDIGVVYGDMSVQVEVKAQWNRNLWEGLNSQLTNAYTKEYKSGGYGVYLVLWFGRKTCKGRYLRHPTFNKFHPAFRKGPLTSSQLNFMLTEDILVGSRDKIRVYVLDMEIKNGRI